MDSSETLTAVNLLPVVVFRDCASLVYGSSPTCNSSANPPLAHTAVTGRDSELWGRPTHTLNTRLEDRHLLAGWRGRCHFKKRTHADRPKSPAVLATPEWLTQHKLTAIADSQAFSTRTS